MRNIPAAHLIDFYKANHRPQYPEKTESVFTNYTHRGSRFKGINKIVSFATQHLAKDYFIRLWNETFFHLPKDKVVARYKRRMDNALGVGAVNTDHIAALHDVGFLPVVLKAIPEGMLVPLRVPTYTIKETKKEFFWLTNYLESLASCVTWHPMYAATVAFELRKGLQRYANETSDMPDFVPWQGHDFSLRGHANPFSAIVSGAAHLLSFYGTDTVAAIDLLEDDYGANSDKEIVGGSVFADEHSVVCANIFNNERVLNKTGEYAKLGLEGTMSLRLYAEAKYILRLINEVHPKGIVSHVSDTFDFWGVVGTILPFIKKEIMARDGKFVVRPDSGDPVKILCGDELAPTNSLQYKGLISCLWDIFGGTTNSKGYRQLDAHIGAIYGDSITLDRAMEICERLKRKKFASTNVVLGVGSFTYQYATRDTFGAAMKATHCIVDGEQTDIFKDPITDSGLKKSAKGLLRVNADLTLSEQVTEEEENQGLLETVFRDGKMVREYTLAEIRARLLSNL